MTKISPNRRPATTLTTAEVLAMIPRLEFRPLDEQARVWQMELADSSPTAMVAVDKTYLAPRSGAFRAVVLDADQATIDVIDFYSAPDAEVGPAGELLTYPQDPAIRISVGAPQLCD